MTRARTILSLLLLPLLISHASAQLGEDIWLTSDWARPVNLPADIQIQSAARIGTTTLAAWGTTVRGTDDSIIPAIVAQRIEGTTPVDGRVFVHGSSARPSGVVSVVNLDTAFVVLWNDRRSGAPGVYARSIGRSGGLIGSEEFFVSTQALIVDSLVWLHREGDGISIVWQSNYGAQVYYHAQRIGPNGEVDGPPQTLRSTNFDDTLNVGTLPGCMIVKSGGDDAHLRYSDGTVDARPIPSSHISNPHFILEDSSIYVLDGVGDSISFLRHYRSLFDSVPFVSLVVDSIAPYWPPNRITRSDSLRGFGGFSRDVAGHLHVWFFRIIKDQASQVLPYFYPAMYSRQLVDSVTLADTVRRANYQSWANGINGHTELSGGVDDLFLKTGDDNFTFNRFSIFSSASNRNSNTYTSSRVSVVVTIGDTGVVPIDNLEKSRFADSSYRNAVPINRESGGALSVVVVELDGSWHRLNTQLAVTPRFAAPLYTGVTSRNGTRLVVHARQVPQQAYVMLDWRSDDLLHPIDTLWAPVAKPTDANGNYTKVQSVLRPFSNMILVEITIESLSGATSPYSGTVSAGHQSHVPTIDGWKSLSGNSKSNAFPGGMTTGYDPNGDVICSWSTTRDRYGSGTDGVVTVGTSNADTIWRLVGKSVFADEPRASIPIGNQRVLLFSSNRVYVVGKDSLVAFVPLATTSVWADDYFRLIGPRILRVMADKVFSDYGVGHEGTVRLQLFDTLGQVKEDSSLSVTCWNYRPIIAQRDSGGAIAFLWTTDQGIHLSLVQTNLSTLIADTLVSTGGYPARHVSAFFEGDTLIYVWEDARFGTSDLFANRWVLPASLRSVQPNPRDTGTSNPPAPPDTGTTNPPTPPDTSTSNPPASPGVITLLTPTPNPAFGESVTVELVSLKSTSVIVEIVDNLGRTVERWAKQTIPIGSTQLTIRTDALHPGAYLVVVTNSDGEMSQTRLVVAR